MLPLSAVTLKSQSTQRQRRREAAAGDPVSPFSATLPSPTACTYTS